MKAILLAGGEGTRLRPLSLRRPKPMLRLFDRPLLEYLICLLRDCGFTQLCMTLRYLPSQITDWFGDGEAFGVELEYRIETAPRGTAGSVRDCADFLNGEDFLVISGDAACSLDLRTFWEKHRISGADATILTHLCPEPAEYGLVVTDGDGAVRSFLEKPAPGSVCTDLVNTGIYALSSRILADIPETGAVDFGADVFPRLLREKRRVLTWNAPGYWNDVGSCEAYRQTCRDVLDGVFPLPIPQGRPFSGDAAVWVSPEAKVSPEASLGAYTLVGAGSVLQAGCTVSGSILDSAFVDSGAEITDSILAAGSHVGAYARLERGCILGDGATVGEGCVLRSGVQIFPGAVVPAHTELRESIRLAGASQPPQFDRSGLLRGEYGRELTAELLSRLGAAEFPGSRIAAASSGGNAAHLLAFAFLTGSAAAGRDGLLLDADSPAAAALCAGTYAFGLTLFVRQQGRQLRLYFFDRYGLPIPRTLQRRLEAALRVGDPGSSSSDCGMIRPFLGAQELERAAIRREITNAKPIPVSVLGCHLLRDTLRDLGFRTVPPEDGVIQFQISEDGFALSAIDETGRSCNHDRLLLAAAAAAFAAGDRELCVSDGASFLHEELAAQCGGNILRLGRDTDALRLYPDQLRCRNGAVLCAFLLQALCAGDTPRRLADLMDRLPTSYREERTVNSAHDLRLLRKASSLPDCAVANGLAFSTDRGLVRIERLKPNELRILAESKNAEFASELCAEFTKKLSELEKHSADN